MKEGKKEISLSKRKEEEERRKQEEQKQNKSHWGAVVELQRKMMTKGQNKRQLEEQQGLLENKVTSHSMESKIDNSLRGLLLLLQCWADY